MDFFDPIKQGVLGFLLFAGNWFLPGQDSASLSVASIKKQVSSYHIVLKMEMTPNRQLEELIDAGIPLNLRFTAASDQNDTVTIVRSLRCHIADLTYSYTDSGRAGVVTSRKYPMILLAFRDFNRWEFDMPASASSGRAEAEILYSEVSQLHRTVDMSRIWGHQKIKTAFTITMTGN